MQQWNLSILLENIGNRFHLTLESYVNRRDILNISGNAFTVWIPFRYIVLPTRFLDLSAAILNIWFG